MPQEVIDALGDRNKTASALPETGGFRPRAAFRRG